MSEDLIFFDVSSNPTLNPTEVNRWLLSHGQTVDLKGKREKFHTYLSEAKSLLENEKLFPSTVPMTGELLNIYQSAKSNLIDTLDKYVSGAADKAFSRDAHQETCDALDDETGCGVGEVFIRELSQNLGSLFLSGIPLFNLNQADLNTHNPVIRYEAEINTCPKSEMVSHDQTVDRPSNPFDSNPASDSETDSGDEGTINAEILLSLLGEAHLTLTNATNCIHIKPSQVLDKDINILSRRRLDDSHMDTKALSTAMDIVEGEINGKPPRDIIECALSEHGHRSKALQSGKTARDRNVMWSVWSRENHIELPKLGFVGVQSQVKAVRTAMARIELSTWGVANLTRNSITQPFDGYGVLSLRQLTEQICEGITTGWRIGAKDKEEDVDF
ncbi:hypothetical protein M231_06802 [Tremella mesenterica]|uniref:Uncharacterized protein n=1 Tax=Tremella mesenterica TaxID=5217 RepID=A0A4Q1BDB8_TREME|nr:hypothetical protein M231_06802 [Tremella mesenterica]